MPPKAVATSQEPIDSGGDSGDEGYDDEMGPGGENKGKRKGHGAQAARRDQNRIAQREFRLRKQQRIRDLELRVELLSAKKDEAFMALDGMMQDLMRENQALRQIVRDLSGFIGDGVGGFLPKLGWDHSSFTEFISRGETDTMSESYQARRKNPTEPAPVVPILAGQKRKPEDEGAGIRKKSKPSPYEDVATSTPNVSSQTSSQFPGPNGVAYSNIRSSSSSGGNNANGTYAHDFTSNPVANSGPYLPPDSQPIATNLSNSRSTLPNVSIPATTGSNTGNMFYNTTPNILTTPNGSYPFPLQHTPTENSTPPLTNASQCSDREHQPRAEEAARLMRYHLNNYKKNPAYCLPSSLRPTQVQRSVPHDFVVDGIPLPDLRDRMILFKGTFDLADCIHTLMSTVTIHSDDILAQANWELSEEWFMKFGHLANTTILDYANKWRRERNDSEIPPSVLKGDGETYDAPAS